MLEEEGIRIFGGEEAFRLHEELNSHQENLESLGLEIIEEVGSLKIASDNTRNNIDQMVSNGEATAEEGEVAHQVISFIEDLAELAGSVVTEILEEA